MPLLLCAAHGTSPCWPPLLGYSLSENRMRTQPLLDPPKLREKRRRAKSELGPMPPGPNASAGNFSQSWQPPAFEKQKGLENAPSRLLNHGRMRL